MQSFHKKICTVYEESLALKYLCRLINDVPRKKIKISGLEITGIADRGKAAGRNEKGQVVFVDAAVPGDTVEALILRKKKSFLQGKTMAIEKYSIHRSIPFCTHFKSCGGCKWQNLDYKIQIQEKEKQIKQNIQKIGKQDPSLVLPIMGAEKTRYYRNKMEYSFSSLRWITEEEAMSDIEIPQRNALGFHAPGSFAKVVEITACHLQEEYANIIRNTIRSYADQKALSYYNPKEKHGFLRNMIIRNSSIGEWMLVMIFGEQKEEEISDMLSFIKDKFSKLTSIYYIINQKMNDSIYDQETVLFYGKERIREHLDNKIFEIGPKSFFQTNTLQAQSLYDVVVDFASFSGEEVVYDLYTGLGSIALYIADKCKQVIGIEEVEPAIVDAKRNAELNQTTNCFFYAGDVRHVMNADFIAKHPKPDLIITDPPRAGMHASVVQTLIDIASPKIVYVSCNPATQARDIELLSARYRVSKIQPVDMFPHTHHVESVALLELK